MRTTKGTILVLGASGKTGGRVAARLAERGISVRRGSRTGSPPFDWTDQRTWVPALTGVESVYVTYQPDVAIPGAEETVRGFAALAASLGVERLVLLSGRGEAEAELAEGAVRRAGTGWTIIQATWFQQNFSEGFLHDSILDGELALPVDGVREPFVDAEDIADIAVAALTEPGHDGATYEVTGPRLLTFAEALGEIAVASGRPLRFRSIPIAEYEAHLRQAQVPEEYVWLLTYLFGTVMDGRNERLTDGVQRALGRPPRDFADYAERTAALGAWDPSTRGAPVVP